MAAAANPKMRQALAARETFVFGKAVALARRIPIEKDKKQAAHIVCERLVAMLNLGRQEYEKGRYGQADRGGGAQGIAE